MSVIPEESCLWYRNPHFSGYKSAVSIEVLEFADEEHTVMNASAPGRSVAPAHRASLRARHSSTLASGVSAMQQYRATFKQ